MGICIALRDRSSFHPEERKGDPVAAALVELILRYLADAVHSDAFVSLL